MRLVPDHMAGKRGVRAGTGGLLPEHVRRASLRDAHLPRAGRTQEDIEQDPEDTEKQHSEGSALRLHGTGTLADEGRGRPHPVRAQLSASLSSQAGLETPFGDFSPPRGPLPVLQPAGSAAETSLPECTCPLPLSFSPDPLLFLRRSETLPAPRLGLLSAHPHVTFTGGSSLTTQTGAAESFKIPSPHFAPHAAYGCKKFYCPSVSSGTYPHQQQRCQIHVKMFAAPKSRVPTGIQ